MKNRCLELNYFERKVTNNYNCLIIFRSGKLKPPEWVDLVKNAKFNELAPYDEDWYFTRCAATLRHIYFRSPVGVGSLTKIFGGKYFRVILRDIKNQKI